MLALYNWQFPSEIAHYTLGELRDLTCAELVEKHEEVIFAYHDAAIKIYGRTGAFPDDLGLPKEDVIPFAIVMREFIKDNELTGFDLSNPFYGSPSAPDAYFSNEISHVCALNPAMLAIEAMGQAAKRLELFPEPVGD